MSSTLVDLLGLQTQPVITLWSDEVPAGALQFEAGKRGCIVSLMAASAKGRICAADQHTFGCPGGGVGLGYGNQYENFPGGVECFTRFLSSGNRGYPKGEAVAQQMAGKAPQSFVDEYLDGERYVKNPELVEDFIHELGFMELEKVTVFKPLDQYTEGETPVSVTVYCDPDQLSALVVLCNSFQPGMNNVIAPFGAGCHSSGLITYRQAMEDQPKAVIGLFDISARLAVQRSLGQNLLSFSAPWTLWQQMEEHAADSFLSRHNWRELQSLATAGD